MKTYACPSCGSKNLDAATAVTGTVVQEPGYPAMIRPDTDLVEINRDWNMWCNECGHCDAGHSFVQEEST